MGYESDSSEFARISTKKLAILFGLAFFGASWSYRWYKGSLLQISFSGRL